MRRTQTLGYSAIVSSVLLFVFAYWVSPADDTQGNAVRLLYIHFPSIMIAYVCCITCGIASWGYLRKKTVWWDYAARSTAEVGTIFCGLTLATGVIWGRPIWNTWFEWGDVRVVTTLILFLLFLGYLALRAMPTQNVSANAKRAAVVALVAVLDIPIIYGSVFWWENRTLHQQSSLTSTDALSDGVKYEGWTLFTLFLGFLTFALITAWLLLKRFRVLWLEGQVEKQNLEAALQKRQEESMTQ